MPGNASVCAGIAGLAFALLIDVAEAYGPEGHLIAGRAAEPMLCDRARGEIVRLGEGQDLGELGLWADRIRSNPAYADAAPWHFMNVADNSSVAAFEHPPEGDVLWAIDHFRGRLADTALDDEARAEALKFLVHFVVDLHQPIHVGRAEDRGGNAIELRFRGEETNLHRLWDTHVIEWAGLSVDAYVERIVRRNRERPPVTQSQPAEVWAEESFALRGQVYAFGRESTEPAGDYMAIAADVTLRRLDQAAARLARTLNDIFCES